MRVIGRTTRVIVFATLGGTAACNNDETSGPENVVTFETVQTILGDNCGSCHKAGSNRFFQVSMDSAQLHQSGLVNPADPPLSLINLKPNNETPHGGGRIASYTAARQAQVNEWIGRLPPYTGNLVQALRVGAGTSVPSPAVDGYYGPAWGQAPPVALRVTGGWGEADFVWVKAVYDETYLYMFISWEDDRASGRRQPWVKQADGSWRVLPAKTPAPVAGTTWAEYMGDNFDEENSARFNYEDKLAVMWNTYGPSTVAGFDRSGCAVTCHDPSQGHRPGSLYNYTEEEKAAKKYTNAPAEIADLWHWKLVRNNQHTKMDDQYVRYWVPGPTGAAEGGRASDEGASGYGNNPAVAGRPQYGGPNITAPPYYIYDNQKVLLTDAQLDALSIGSEIANMITSGPTGLRADVDAKGIHSIISWGLELRRKLVTGDPTDVQFDNLTREYAFGIATFDNAQIEHRYTPLVARLVFRP